MEKTRRPLATLALIASSVVASAALWQDVEVVTHAAEIWRNAPAHGVATADYWSSILWSVLLHSGWSHLLMNGVALLACGSAVERKLGTPRTLALFVASGVCGSTAQALWWGHGDIGASGVVYGCVGAVIASLALRRGVYSRRTRIAAVVLVVWGIIGIARSIAGTTNIGNASHATGFLVGVFFGLLDRED